MANPGTVFDSELIKISEPEPVPVLRREIDSLDDFEHLGHDSSPLKETTSDLSELKSARDEINKGVEIAATTTNPTPLSEFDRFSAKMDTNLLEMGDNLTERHKEETWDKFLQDLDSLPAPKHEESPEIKDKDIEIKTATQQFMELEREPLQPKKEEILEKYSDSEDDDFKPSKFQDFPKKSEFMETFETHEPVKPEAFKDVEVEQEKEPELPKKDYPKPPEVEKIVEAIPEALRVCKFPLPPKSAGITDAEAIFCKMGLDAWFNPERLNPKVESLIYWRDPKKSGPVFGGVLVVLLALTYFSLISVVAYVSLFALTGTISFRIYKNIVQAVQKTGDGHPFKEFLELDVSLPQDKVKEVSEVAVAHLNAAVVEVRRLFLVEDLVDSIKFGVLLWTLTYLGSWFNGMTLIIIGWVALFTLPKVYEANKTQIDANLDIVRTKLADITSKVKAAIPIGKKAVEDKKEQ